jgi:hypothetical protein
MGKMKEREGMEEPGVDGRMISKETQRNRMEYCEEVSGEGQVTGCCVDCYEPSGSINCGEILTS